MGGMPENHGRRPTDPAGRGVELGPEHGLPTASADTLAALLNTAFSLIALITAAMIAVELVRKTFRLNARRAAALTPH